MEAVVGRLNIRSAHARQLKAWALDVNGKRVREVPLTATAHMVTLEPKAVYETSYYELSDAN